MERTVGPGGTVPRAEAGEASGPTSDQLVYAPRSEGSSDTPRVRTRRQPRVGERGWARWPSNHGT
eukprot:6187647-Pleurochrysis_carterae.AAC.5